MNRQASSGFSLIEVLITVGILSLLYVLTSAAIYSLRQRSKEAQCVSRIRQLFVAFQLYRTQHNGESPPSYPNSVPPDQTSSTAARTHNRLGHYYEGEGLVAQGLGRLYQLGFLPQPGLLYCPGDMVLSEESRITGLEDLAPHWRLRYPLLTSYVLRPIGRTVPEEEAAALTLPLESNSGTKALLAEVSGNHPDVVIIARINGSVERIRGLHVYARPITAVGIEGSSGETLFQGAYEVDIGLSGLFWLPLDGDGVTGTIPPTDDNEYPYPVDDHGRVTLCHKETGNPHTLRLPPDAVPAHLAHGDTLGPCED